MVSLATAMIPNPIFGRMMGPPWWTYPTLVITSILAGMVTATYVREPTDARGDRVDPPATWGTVGGLLSFFAVGCPICNKLVLLVLGTSGALSFFAPLQPILALVSSGALSWALWSRLGGLTACATTGPLARGEL